MSQRQSTAIKAATAMPSQMALPFWPDHLRGVPTAALYSALFAPIRRGTRKAVEREPIAAVGGYKIIYTGFRLDQSDLDVFEQCIHLSRQRPLGQPVLIRTRDLLQQVGRSTGKSDREWLLRSLSRLKACEVEIQKGHTAYSGSLIHEQGRDDAAGMHYICLHPRLTKLFDQGYSQVVWNQRMKLAGKPLAQWLHGFVAASLRPLSFHVTDLMRYAQSSYARTRDFRAALDDAAAEIREAGVPLVIFWSADHKTATFSRSDLKGSATAIPQEGG